MKTIREESRIKDKKLVSCTTHKVKSTIMQALTKYRNRESNCMLSLWQGVFSLWQGVLLLCTTAEYKCILKFCRQKKYFCLEKKKKNKKHTMLPCDNAP
jgi:hypothetical protein